MKKIHRWLLVSFIVLVSIGCDQISKGVAQDELIGEPRMSFLGDTFRLQYAENKGAMLSLGASFSEDTRFWIFQVVLSVLLFGALAAAFLWRELTKLSVVGIALMAGGGVSNLIDRFVNDGAVVDFMNLGLGSVRTGIFNVADIGIMVGAFLLALQAFSGPVNSEEPENPEAPEAT